MASSVVKSRYWAFVAYPESLPENWQEILQSTGCPIAVSPLHDKDTDPTGELKKSHYHIIYCSSGPTTFNAVNRVCQSLNGTIPQVLGAVRGYYRYFTHIDNPDKFQYDPKEILHINGFCPDDYFTLTSSEEDQLYSEIELFIRDRLIYELFDLVFLCKDEGLEQYLSFIRRHTIYFSALLRSRREGLKAHNGEAAKP